MARDFFINGETMVYCKNSALGGLQQLGLSDNQISVSPSFKFLEIQVNAWGDEPPEVQFMLASVDISISLVHFDRALLDICISESMGGAPSVGQLPRAGARMGNNLPLQTAGNHYIQLSLSSPVGNKPWNFLACYLSENPVEFPLGNERSIVSTKWHCIPFSTDPWGGGTGSQGIVLWNYATPS